jgi:hypothetical protein
MNVAPPNLHDNMRVKTSSTTGYPADKEVPVLEGLKRHEGGPNQHGEITAQQQ